MAEERGIPTVAEFFGDELAARLVREGRRADVIHAHNVLAHVADLNGFVHGIARLLKPNGVAVIEVPYVRDLVEGAAFDTIYHEHLCYFSLTALDGAVPSPRARRSRTSSRSRSTAARCGCSSARARLSYETVGDVISDEGERGMHEIDYYLPLAEKAVAVKQRLRNLLHDLKRRARADRGVRRRRQGRHPAELLCTGD